MMNSVSQNIQTTNLAPILLIVFNRPDKVERLLAALAEIKPPRIYVAADGPRIGHPTDAGRSTATRALFDNLSWDCEIITHFQEQNLGCKRGVSTAISWFFTQVEAGIILEDDCVPAPTFISYASNLLEIYKNNEQIMHITGTTFLTKDPELTDSYFFSKLPLIWGWATWRRAWKRYDINVLEIGSLREKLFANQAFKNRAHSQFWVDLCTHIHTKNIDTWDAQWAYTVLYNSGITITPAYNLIHNIGFDADATHTTEISSTALPISDQAYELNTLRHPDNMTVNKELDSKIMETAFVDTLKKKIKYTLKSYL